MVKKRKLTKVIGLLSVVIIILGIFLISSFANSTGQITNFVSGPNCNEEQVPYEEQEEYTETIPYTDSECEYKPLIYSITDFNIQSECLDYDERCIDFFLGICTEKETFCVKKSTNFELNLNNFDEERGSWAIKFNLYGTGSLLDTKSQNVFLYPKESTGLYWTFTLNGEEDCKKEITGNYIVETEPSKQICKDVTRYKDVVKTRTITKYKTENVCE